MKKSIDNSLYKKAIIDYEKYGSTKLGPLSSKKYIEDPQYIMFQMSRYKHACRLLSNKSKVADIGTGDGIGLGIMSNYFKKVFAVDIDEYLIQVARKHNKNPKIIFKLHNFYKSELKTKIDAAVCFDVISSIPKKFENAFLSNISKSLKKDGILILGTQNKLATKFSKKKNLKEQPNFKTYNQLNSYILKYFKNSIILSMNDETVHTGKRETSQYFIAMGIGVK
tara:strand:- start:120 stop:791 length:672 start_codon:yes stop_codon:yes gene_type:complete